MESRVPLPADNIFKFYALFGLMLLITSIIGTAVVSTSTNEKLYELVKEHKLASDELAKGKEVPLLAAIEKRIEIQIKDKKVLSIWLGVTSGISVLLMFYGFRQWHTKIQPKKDEYFELQTAKLKLEIETLKKQSS